MVRKSLSVLLLILLLVPTIIQPAFSNTQPAKALTADLSTDAGLPSAQVADLISGPLSVSADNPRYFADPSGNIVFLTGSHTWCNFMDCDDTNPIVATFNYTAYLDFLISKNHNFFRLWRAENARGGESGPNFWFNPMPYQRSNTCCAFDGGNKFNLTSFNQAYFDRMRQRVIAARDRGIYVSIMLFDGWSVESKFGGHNPWAGHPYKLENNINNIDGDTNNDNQGGETHTLSNAYITTNITPLQQAYVRKVIDTVNDLDNVLYEISNESPPSSEAWQYQMINYIRSYESTKPKQHPIGMTWEWPGGNNADLYNSPADWISLGGNVDLNTYVPPAADGSKVILADTDHLCGICGSRQWVWKSFTRGENPIFMDIYNNATSGRGMPFSNSKEGEIRNNLGYIRNYANRMDLAEMTPQPNLCSTGYCLAKATASGAEYLAYLPSGGSININLSAAQETLTVEWFNTVSGTTVAGGSVNGGATRTLTAPFAGDAVIYLKAAPPPPSHDDFNSAKVVSGVPYQHSVNITGATVAADDPLVPSACDGSFLAKGNKSVWYRYTPANSAVVYLDTFGSTPINFNTYIAVWTGTRGNLSFVGCDNDAGGSHSQLALNAAAGTTYFIEVAEYNGTQGGAPAPSIGGTLKFHVTSFQDVPGNHPDWRYIEALYVNGLTGGCSVTPRRFCPELTMDRAQMAVFTLRGTFGSGYVPPPEPWDTFFDDWSRGQWAEPWAEGMIVENLSAGCQTTPVRLFCPWELTTREQAAVFAMRIQEGNAYEPPPAQGTVFADLTDANHWSTPWVEQAYASGLLPACGSSGGKPKICPTALVDRGLGAYLITRAKDIAPLP